MNIKKILLLVTFLFWIIFFNFSFAEKNTNQEKKDNNIINLKENNNITSEIEKIKKMKKNYFLKENIKIDLSLIWKKLKNQFDWKYIIKWEIKWKKDVYNPILNLSFEKTWEKSIFLKIIDKKTKKEKLKKEIKVFIYKKIIPFIFSKEIEKNNIEYLQDFYKKFGILVYNIWIFDSENLINVDLLSKIEEFKNLKWKKVDYIWIWWWKDFIFDVFSKIDLDKKNKKNNEKLNFLAISNYNIKILDNYLNNFIANKIWLDKIILTDKKSLYSLEKDDTINSLEKNFIKNKIDFQDVRLKNNWINKYLFISKFINNLSNKGFDTTSIYIFILIPFILTLLGFIKHFIWFSTLGITIPLILTILLFKFWVVFIWIFFISFIIYNLFLSFLFSKYILLYTPKMSMMIILNIIFFILIFNLLIDYWLFSANLNNIFYLILFVIVSERLISIILSKEFSEYKNGLLITFLVSLFLFLLFIIPQIKILILAYPEIILILVPINFLIWKFTGLRITEYFRFKEVIKNIEE